METLPGEGIGRAHDDREGPFAAARIGEGIEQPHSRPARVEPKISRNREAGPLFIETHVDLLCPETGIANRSGLRSKGLAIDDQVQTRLQVLGIAGNERSVVEGLPEEPRIILDLEKTLRQLLKHDRRRIGVALGGLLGRTFPESDAEKAESRGDT